MREICLYQNTTNVTQFNFEGHQICVVNLNGEPGFVARGVAMVLGYANPRKAVRDHCKAARPLGDEHFVHPSLAPQTIIITECDLDRLIMHSTLPSAEHFKEFVYGKVLPTIRQTGADSNSDRILELLNDPATLRLIIATYEEHIEELKAQITRDKPKVEFYDSIADTDDAFEHSKPDEDNAKGTHEVCRRDVRLI